MKAKLSFLWKCPASINHFFNQGGYSGASRAHAEICLQCWIQRVLERCAYDPFADTQNREFYQKCLRKRQIRCPSGGVLLPWGRNRKTPPSGCLRVFEHSLVKESG